MDKLIVAGYGKYEDGGTYVIVKDIVSKNPLLKLSKATKTGAVAVAKGFTIEHAMKELPIGTQLTGVKWGEQVESDFGGIYKVLELGAEAEEEEKS